MATHFLLTAAARTLSLRAIYKRGEEKAFELFCQLRWPETGGTPVCPRCGCCESYNIKTRRKLNARHVTISFHQPAERSSHRASSVMSIFFLPSVLL